MTRLSRSAMCALALAASGCASNITTDYAQSAPPAPCECFKGRAYAIYSPVIFIAVIEQGEHKKCTK